VFFCEIIFFHGLEKFGSGLISMEVIEDQHFQLMFEGKGQWSISSGDQRGNVWHTGVYRSEES
jgi:hypothetical protein